MIYLIHGDEKYLIYQKIKELIDDEKNIVSFDAEDKDFSVDDLIFEMDSISIFNDKKIIKIKNTNLFFNKIDEKKCSYFLELLKKYNNINDIIFYSEISINSNLKSVKEFKKNVKEFKFEKIKNYDLKKYIDLLIDKYKLQIKSNELNYLYQILPKDLTKIDQELLKLSIYPKELTIDVIANLINLDIDNNIFDIIDMLLNNKIDRSLIRFEELLAINTPLQIIIAIFANQIRFLFKVKYLLALNQSIEDIAKSLKQNFYRVKKSAELLNHYDFQKMLFILNKLAILEQKIKSTNNLNLKELFELFIIDITKDGI